MPALLADLATSAEHKAAVSDRLRSETLEREAELLATIADAMAARFRAGGRLFTFGNGGSSTDAASVAVLFARHHRATHFRPAALPTTRPCSARWATTSASSWSSRAS